MKCLFYGECMQPINLRCVNGYELCEEYKRLEQLEIERCRRLKVRFEVEPKGLDFFADTPEREGVEI